MQIAFSILLFILGACFGSFLCCQARRLHYANRRAKTANSKKSRKNSLGARSVCLHCHYQLRWYDNIPIISWLALKGKCRKCGKKIGAAELLSELGISLAFLLISTTINPLTAASLDWAIFLTVLVLTLSLGFLAIYDGLYGELPVSLLIFSIICAAAVLLLRQWTVAFSPCLIIDPLLSALILGGLYLVLYLVSSGRWVGDGDWLLALAIALALASPWLALVNLFLANFLASLVMYPLTKGKKQKKVHFGPFLVAAFVLTYALADFILPLFG